MAIAYNVSPENPVNSIPSPRFKKGEKKNVPIVPSVWDPVSVRSIHKGNWDADERNRIFRSRVQAMADGWSPWKVSEMQAAGLASCCNLDWGYGRTALRKKMVPYVESLNSLRTFMSIKTDFGSPRDRIEWERKMSRNHYKLYKHTWGQEFVFRYLYICLYFNIHGVSFGYFNDDIDPRWCAASLDDMVVDRMARADNANFASMSTNKNYTPKELFDYIKYHDLRDGEWTEDDEQGWHVPTVRRVLEKAHDMDFFKANDWMLQEREIKNLETYFNRSGKVCSSIILWVNEVDGSVTQCIAPENQINPATKVFNPNKKEQCMYRRSKFFDNMSQAAVMFARDIGTNGDIHSIRGTGSDILQIVQALNKLRCRMYDATQWEISIPVRATDEAAAAENMWTFMGPAVLIENGVTMMDRSNPNYSRSAFPAIQMMIQDLRDVGGKEGSVEQPGSKMDLEGLLDKESQLDIMESTLFNLSINRLFQESLRRLIAIKSIQQPGGFLGIKFREMCINDGVPEEAIDQINIEDSIATRPIGNGSPQARFAALSAAKEFMPNLDETGRYNLVRDCLYSIPALPDENVEDYAPLKEGMRPGLDVRFAQEENFRLMNQGIAPVHPNDDHIVHLEEHLVPMKDLLEKVESGKMTEAQAVIPLYPLWMHAQEHEELALQDPLMKPKVGKLKKGMQELGEIITNGQRQLQAEQDKKQKEQASGQSTEGGQQGPAPLTPEQMYKFEKARVDLKDAEFDLQHKTQMMGIQRMAAMQKMQNAHLDAKQKRQIADLKAASSLA